MLYVYKINNYKKKGHAYLEDENSRRVRRVKIP